MVYPVLEPVFSRRTDMARVSSFPVALVMPHDVSLLRRRFFVAREVW